MDHVKAKRDSRQDFVFSSLIFYLFSDRIFDEALLGIEKGFLIGIRLNNTRYSDDTILLANHVKD